MAASTDDDVRLDALMEELANAEEDGAPLPPVSRADAAAIARRLHAEMDRGTAARHRAAVERGAPIACEKGCAGCCETPVLARAAEAAAIAELLAEEDHAAARAHFLEAYAPWRAALGDVPDRLAGAARRGDMDETGRLLRAGWRRRAMCPFNADGACTVYPVRPNVCRGAHALYSSEHCTANGDPDQPHPDVLRFAPIERFLHATSVLNRALDRALRPGRRELALLADLVHELLTTGAFAAAPAAPAAPTRRVGRNEPCPCGSGKKYKRCCGAS